MEPKGQEYNDNLSKHLFHTHYPAKHDWSAIETKVMNSASLPKKLLA